jgi:hypothetical protein
VDSARRAQLAGLRGRGISDLNRMLDSNVSESCAVGGYLPAAFFPAVAPPLS